MPVDLFSAGAGSSSSSSSSDFNRGIAYLLIKDTTVAKKYFKSYFMRYPNPNLENGFRLLTEERYRDATQQFSYFLEISPRSTLALVGIALSTSTMAVSNAEELLKRALRLDPKDSVIYLCLGMEYVKEKNYPLAEQNLKRALALVNAPEYKILLGRLYLDMNKPDDALALVKSEADRAPDNFHFNFLAAQACFKSNRLSELGRYSQVALDAQPGNNDVRLLMANYYLSRDDAHKANLILKGMKFEDYNEDYMKSYGHALVLLKEKKARDYLYEVFARKKWDGDINRLLGLYHLWMGDKGVVQHWIYRAILSGAEISRLKEVFPSEYKYPEYKFLPFFDVKQVVWIADDTILAAASRESGESEKIFLIDLQKMQVVQAMSFNGKLQEIFASANRENMALCAAAKDNAGVYLYALSVMGRNIRLQPIWDKPLAMLSALVGFDRTGTQAYITDRKIESLAFESPFSQVGQYGKKKPVYPVYPFSIYKYNFVARKLVRLTEVGPVESAPPIDAVKKYALVANAFSTNSEVQTLVEKGQQLDLTSSEMVKTYFPATTAAPGALTHFIIYISDLKNAFHGVAWDQSDNRATPVDETVFLGRDNYAELDILDFDPLKKEILVLTKNEKDLILYNYKSQSSIRLAKVAFNVHYNRPDRMVYILNERSDKLLFAGSGLQAVSLSPYVNKSVASQKNLVDIISCGINSEVYFSSGDGEIVKMDGEYNFSYVGPDMEGCVYAASPSEKRTAAFINGKLWLIE
ncbi:MAG: tetratricopeptide repeat protein [Candidatus Aminicenantes bacterium]|nr:tetratricopeptide repeat protein [Candidatus Aminicenantes bacterium]